MLASSTEQNNHGLHVPLNGAHHAQNVEQERLHSELDPAWSLAQDAHINETTPDLAVEDSDARPPNVTFLENALSLPPVRQMMVLLLRLQAH